MLRLLLLFLIASIPVQAVELLRDRHGSEEYIFEVDQTEMTAAVDAAAATVRATDWATHFYEDLPFGIAWGSVLWIWSTGDLLSKPIYRLGRGHCLKTPSHRSQPEAFEL